MESTVLAQAREADPVALQLLRSIPGVGKIISLVILYEIEDISRFAKVGNFISYARLVKCSRESAGKSSGARNSKIGNAHLKWAFSEAAVLFLKDHPAAKDWHDKLVSRYARQGAVDHRSEARPDRVLHAQAKGALRSQEVLRTRCMRRGGVRDVHRLTDQRGRRSVVHAPRGASSSAARTAYSDERASVPGIESHQLSSSSVASDNAEVALFGQDAPPFVRMPSPPVGVIHMSPPAVIENQPCGDCG